MAKKGNENIETQEVKTEVVKEVEIKGDKEIDMEKEKMVEMNKENEQLKNEVNELKAMMQQMLSAQQSQITNKVENTSSQKVTKRPTYHKIDDNEFITLVSMFDGGVTLTAKDVPDVRFEQFGDTAEVVYKDLSRYKNNHPQIFKDLLVRVLDERAVENLRLTKEYEEYQIDEYELENMFLELDAQSMIAKVLGLPKRLQESFISLVIKRASENDNRYMDYNKFVVLQNEFKGLDIQRFINIRRGSQE